MGFLDRLRNEIFVFDGAMGTMLQANGLTAGDCPEEWNITHPEVVQKIHRGYLEAGSDVIETNTFGGTRFKLGKFGMGDKVAEFNRAGARLAKELAGNRLVAGSVGPTGELLKPLGRISEEEMYGLFTEQIIALKEGGVDIICIETMSDLRETQIAIRAAKENTHLPVIATMLFELGIKGFRTMMGTDIETAANGLLEAGADVIGTNCGNGTEGIVQIVGQMRAYTSAPILAQPNAGVPKLLGDKTIFPETPEFMAGHVNALIEAGANLVGGCCGTTPAHIRAIVNEIRGGE